MNIIKPVLPANTEEALTIMQEECAEVIQAIAKIKRFGFDSHYPNTPPEDNNRKQLNDELGDVLAMMHVLYNLFEIDAMQIASRARKKLRKLETYSDISRENLIYSATFWIDSK